MEEEEEDQHGSSEELEFIDIEGDGVEQDIHTPWSTGHQHTSNSS